MRPASPVRRALRARLGPARIVRGCVPARVEVRDRRGERLLVHGYEHDSGEYVRAIGRFETDGDRVVRIRNDFHTPEFITEVCGELGVPIHANGYRYW